MKQNIIFFLLLMMSLIFLPHNGEAKKFVIKQFEPALTIVTDDRTEHIFTVEIAQTAKQLSKGLMWRAELEEDAGMLFLFPKPTKPNFWMKNTFIPLDLIFIETDGRIQHIHHNAKPQDETFMTSPSEVIAVLEVPGGTAKRLNIMPDHYVHHSFFQNLNLLDK